MSKSRGNVINPDEYIDRYGSDNMRAYLLFCGPWEEGGDFNDRSLNGVVRFNDRLTGYLEQGPPSGPGGVDMSRLDRAIHKIGKDIEALKFNTAIAELMSLSNWFRDEYAAMNNEEWDRTRRTFALLLAPLEPFLAEELWEQLGARVRRGVAQPDPTLPEFPIGRTATLAAQPLVPLSDLLPRDSSWRGTRARHAHAGDDAAGSEAPGTCRPDGAASITTVRSTGAGAPRPRLTRMDQGRRNPDCGGALEHGDDASAYPARACHRSTQLRALNMLNPLRFARRTGRRWCVVCWREVRALTTRGSCCWPA